MATVDIQDTGVKLRAKRIGIIGAGSAGLAATRVFAEENAKSNDPPFVITVLERNSAIGGIWRYTPTATCRYNVPQASASAIPPALDERCAQTHGFPTPIYDELNTNLPKDVMQFPDMAFADTASEFPTRSQVLEYLEEYARTKVLVHPFDLRLNTDVEDVAFDAARNVWTCQTRDLRTDVAQTLEFDAILVCTGRVSYPFIPDVPGLHELAAQRPSLVVHAKEYRRPHDYAGQCVLVVGGASSATDISRQLSFVAREVHISTADDSLADTAARDPRMNPLIGDACDPQRPLIQHPRIAEFSSTHVMFADGTEIPVPDSIIYATGYICAFPFLRHVERLVHAPDPGLPFTADGDGVADMYRFLLYAVNPLLAILGVPNKVVPFVLYEYQATYLAHLYQGHITLPPFAQMLSQARDAQELPRPFTMGFKQIAYLNDLIDCVGDRQSRLGHIPPCWGDRWKQTLKLRKDFLGY